MSLEEAHDMAHHIEGDIREKLSNASVTIHLEPCDTDCDKCSISSCSLRIDMRR
jgi:divalent metal cation (Fe/Co/Zn/Cd) transporter